MQALGPFFQLGGNCEPRYEAVRDSDRNLDARKFVESLWFKYHAYADPHFLSDARQHFQERFWEMYLGCTLLQQGLTLDVKGKKGPEFCTKILMQNCWFEAIAPGAGTTQDAVPEMKFPKVDASGKLPRLACNNVPTKEILLRLRGAIHEKHRKYQEYVKEGIVAPDESYVIAINSKRIRTIISENEVPWIVKAVLPFGDLAISFDEHGNSADPYYTYRDSIKKKSGGVVSTNVFCDESFVGISAVLYSSVDASNHPVSLGADFKLVHNPLATNPIPRRALMFGVEYWVENNELHSKNWSEDFI